jgi:hypothetical protein
VSLRLARALVCRPGRLVHTKYMTRAVDPDAEHVRQLIRWVCDMFRAPNGVYVTYSHAKNKQVLGDKAQWAHDLLDRVPDEQIALVTSLWSFLYEISGVVPPQEDLDVLKAYTPDQMYEALMCARRHPMLARTTARLVVEEHRSSRPFTRRPAASTLSHDSISMLVVSGSLLLSVEERDPHMQITRPGIKAYFNGPYVGDGVNCNAMMNAISDTLDRIMLPVE